MPGLLLSPARIDRNIPDMHPFRIQATTLPARPP